MNLHLRTVLLGTAAQLMMVMVELLPARRRASSPTTSTLPRVLAPGLPRHRVHRLRGVRPQLRGDRPRARPPLPGDPAAVTAMRAAREAGAGAVGEPAPPVAPVEGSASPSSGAGPSTAANCASVSRRWLAAGAWSSAPGDGSATSRSPIPPRHLPAALAVHAHDQQPAARHDPGRGVPLLRARPGAARADLDGGEEPAGTRPPAGPGAHDRGRRLRVPAGAATGRAGQPRAAPRPRHRPPGQGPGQPVPRSRWAPRSTS